MNNKVRPVCKRRSYGCSLGIYILFVAHVSYQRICNNTPAISIFSWPINDATYSKATCYGSAHHVQPLHPPRVYLECTAYKPSVKLKLYFSL